MIWLLKFLFFGHVHQWEELEKWPMGRVSDDTLLGNRYFCRCVKCGAMRNFDCF